VVENNKKNKKIVVVCKLEAGEKKIITILAG
jgi:hypothetical protein